MALTKRAVLLFLTAVSLENRAVELSNYYTKDSLKPLVAGIELII